MEGQCLSGTNHVLINIPHLINSHAVTLGPILTVDFTALKTFPADETILLSEAKRNFLACVHQHPENEKHTSRDLQSSHRLFKVRKNELLFIG